MTWQAGPLESWFDIHEALKNEFPRLRKMAGDVTLDDADELRKLSDEIVFFAEVLTVHSLSEDGVGFPIMRNRGIDIPAALSDDHHRELEAVYDIRRSCLELLFHDADQDVSPALDRLRNRIAALEEDLAAHIRFEDDVIIPQAMEKFSRAEQAALVVKMVAHTPAWLSDKVLPWMIANISERHRVHLLEVWFDSMPGDVLRTRVRTIRNGVSPDLWKQLVEQVPRLASVSA
jgi:hemerythrin-like domain-containing protein